MNRAKIRRLRSQLPWTINQLIFWFQRKSLMRAIGSFHAAWSELEWRIWALDTADYANGAFLPIATLAPRSFLKKSRAHNPVSDAIRRLEGKIDEQVCLEELNKRRNRIIHGAISSDRYTFSVFETSPVLISSRLVGFAWADRHPIPTLRSTSEGELRRYRDILNRRDISDLIEKVEAVTRELDTKYLLPLQDELTKPDEMPIDDEVLDELIRHPVN